MDQKKACFKAYNAGILSVKLMLAALYQQKRSPDEIREIISQLQEKHFAGTLRGFLLELPAFYAQHGIHIPPAVHQYHKHFRSARAMWFALGFVLYLDDWERGTLEPEDRIKEELSHE